VAAPTGSDAVQEPVGGATGAAAAEWEVGVEEDEPPQPARSGSAMMAATRRRRLSGRRERHKDGEHSGGVIILPPSPTIPSVEGTVPSVHPRCN
jgi:hypothetical protein